MKFSTYYFHIKMKILADFQMCINVPLMYWIPKMYKNHVGSRFIITSSKYILKPLSNAITAIFKLFHKNEKYNSKNTIWWEKSNFGSSKMDQPVTDSINKLNFPKKVQHVPIFDYSPLPKYLMIKLFVVRNMIIWFLFIGGI